MSYKLQDEAPPPALPKRSAPRVNVVVTREQHALLLELASLEQGMSAAGFLRELLDRVTPLLRKTVPMMRAAAQAKGEARQELKEAVGSFLAEMQQLDLLDAPAAPGAPAASDGGARPDAPARRSRARK